MDLTSAHVRSLLPGTEHINFIQFAPDGRRFAIEVIRAGKCAVEVCDAITGQVQRSLSHPKEGILAWHPDGRTLATLCGVDDRLIRLWDSKSGQLLRVLEGHKNTGVHGAFTHTGDRLVSNDWSDLLRI